MSIVKVFNKERNITYVYESESYWDKEIKQPRSRRKLIGRIDPETGETVPTGKRGRKAKDESVQKQSDIDYKTMYEKAIASIKGKDDQIRSLQERLSIAEDKVKSCLQAMNKASEILTNSISTNWRKNG